MNVFLLSRVNKVQTLEMISPIGRDEESFNAIESQLSVDDIQSLIDNLPDGYKMVFNLFA
jgi:RNA polymerase sigma-70 factor (ECF subfamily)